MAIVDLFHIRQKRIRGEYPDVYQYEDIPEQLKNKIVNIWRETIGRDRVAYSQRTIKPNREYLKSCYIALCKGFGVLNLGTNISNDEYDIIYLDVITEHFLYQTNIDEMLSVIELMTQYTENFSKEDSEVGKIDINEVVNELNQHFREHGVGYQYENGQIIRVDSEFIHSEAVKPALQLLSNPMYKGAQEEFLKAHEHYRHGRYDSALTDCLKAFESTMKIILDKHGWEYDKNRDTASKLINCCIRNELIPKFWTDHFTSLNNILTSSIPTPRNKLSGHGKGNKTVEVPEPLLQYVLHMTASTIVFLVKAEETLN
ncbi:STM4504/CBY_0614 family protein [Psychrobacter sp. ASPA161_6]|uniref:STM4504/CBY_0614 family protein n=1 Tax=Psychrobacter sp. ASPA161_6 TaxID=3160962 RepID=UPI003F7E6821